MTVGDTGSLQSGGDTKNISCSDNGTPLRDGLLPLNMSIATSNVFDLLAHFYTGKMIFLFLIKVSNRPLVTRYSAEIRQHFGGPLRVTVATIHAGTVINGRLTDY
jgi:hypothetical protein